MKKFLLALIALCAAATTNAQVEPSQASTVKFHYGFKGGLNFTTYSSDADDFQARMGQWGVLCRWNIGEHFAIQPELFYARMGCRSLTYTFRYHNENTDNFGTNWPHGVDVKFKLKILTDNVQLPIMFKYYLPINMWKGVNVQAGPMFSQRFDYKLSTSASDNGYLISGQIGARGESRNFARDQNQFTVLASYGLGYDSESGIGVDLRCSMGLTPVFKGKRQTAFTNARDRVWSISFNYVF